MKLFLLYIVFQLSFCLVHCQHLEWDGTEINNNSVIYYGNIRSESTALKCVTDNTNCCSPNTGNWMNQTGQIANQEPDEDRCLYFTRGDRVMSLNRLWVCIPPLAGLWRCDVPDSSGEIQSLFIYIATSHTSGQLSDSMTINFTLHTEPRVGPPQFTISCQTHGGPATEVSWFWNRRKRLTKIVTESNYVILMEGSRNHSVYIETSQTILDTSDLPVYDNKLLVRGRVGGEFTCTIKNTFYSLLRTNTTTITVAGEPSKLTGVISSSNNTHVNVTVSWESPADTATTGNVIYYQPKTGGPVISESVTGGHRESHSRTGLQRGHTYNISIVALSQHLPSPLVGPVTVVTTGTLLVVETSPQLLYVTLNEPFSLTCTVRVYFDGNPVNTTIKWIHITTSNLTYGMEPVTEQSPVFANSSEPQYGSDYSSAVLVVESAMESGTFIYRCEATALNTTSFNDTIVVVKEMPEPTNQLLSTISTPATINTCAFSAYTETSVATVFSTITSTSLVSGSTAQSNSPTTTMAYTDINSMVVSLQSVMSSNIAKTTTLTIFNTPPPCSPLPIPSSSNFDDCSKMDSCTEKPATLDTVTEGGVGGALVLIIVIEFIAILFLWKFRRSPGRGRENVKTETNTAYGVVSRREEPEYEVIGLSQSRHHNATN